MVRSWAEVRLQAAHRLMAANPAGTYSGEVPDPLLAIPVLEIELIQWKSGESPHREFIERGREGIHHVQFRVDDCDGWIERVRPLGYELIWYKNWSADTRFGYLERPGDPTLIEFLEMPPGGAGGQS